MNVSSLFIAYLAAVGAAAIGIPSQAADTTANAGLIRVKSRQFAQLYVRPNSDLSGYRKVVIEPVPVTFRKGWNKTGSVKRRFSAAEVARISDETAARVRAVFAEAFTAQGYEIAAAPGPGVLRLSPSVHDLYINAPDSNSAGVTSYAKEFGSATLHVDISDATTGELLLRVVDHRKAEAARASTANGVSNRFWLETMFRRWAAACATELAATKERTPAPSTGSSATEVSTRQLG